MQLLEKYRNKREPSPCVWAEGGRFIMNYCNYCEFNKPSFFDIIKFTFFSFFISSKTKIVCSKCKKQFIVTNNQKNKNLIIVSGAVWLFILDFLSLLPRMESLGKLMFFICIIFYYFVIYLLYVLIRSLLLFKFGVFSVFTMTGDDSE